MLRRGSSSALAIAIVAAALVFSPRAAAEPTPESRKAAARQFAEAERAYAAEDWTRAANAFEAAYKAAPHPDPLWNAARAWQRAGENARAANLYARYLREAPGNAHDRGNATKALAQLAQKLGRIEIHAAAGIDDLKIDAKPIEGESVFVVPGAHVVSGREGTRNVEQTVNVAAGSVISVALVEASQPAPAPTVLASPPPPAPTTAQPSPVADTPPPKNASRGISPVFVWVGVAVTVVAGGVTVWSGLDTAAARRDWDTAPTQQKLDAGRTKMTRTNVLLGATVGLGVLTAAAAIFVVDWRAADTKVTFGPTSASIEGTF